MNKNIEIREMRTRKEIKQFIRFVNELYKDSPCYCPPLFTDAVNGFSEKHNPSLKVADWVLYMAYIDNKPVGRIAGIINHEANKAWNNKRVRFGWFDFIDDQCVSHALLDAVQEWGKIQGMTELNGPVGFTDFDPQGLLIEGFDNKSPMVSFFTYPYYPAHFETYGLAKEVDWLEFKLDYDMVTPAKMERVANIVKDRFKLRIDKVKSVKELKAKYGYSYMDMMDLAYQPLYNFQPLTPEQKKKLCDANFPFLNFDFVTLVINEANEPVGLAVSMPDVGDALRSCGGKLFPFGWYKLLKMLKSKTIESLTLLIIGVHPDYQGKGVNSLFIADQVPYVKKYGVKRVETTSILEHNYKSLSNFTDFPKTQHKRRRAYIKSID